MTVNATCVRLLVVSCLMDDAVGALRERQRILGEAIKHATRELASRNSHGLRTRCSDERVRHLTARSARVVWIMYSLDSDPSGAVLHFLRGSGGKFRVCDIADKPLLEIAERSFLDADLEYVTALADVAHPADAKAMRVARRQLAEWKLFEWCESLNVNKGATPSTGALLRRAQQCGDALPDAIFALSPSGSIALVARAWAQKWRRRWGARLGTLRVRETLSVDEMRSKVLQFLFENQRFLLHSSCVSRLLRRIAVPILSPDCGLSVCGFLV